MISLEWCNEYVDISDLDPKDLAVKITTAGTNIEKVYSNKNDYLVIGYVKECVPHPDSDHMKVCQVDVTVYTRFVGRSYQLRLQNTTRIQPCFITPPQPTLAEADIISHWRP